MKKTHRFALALTGAALIAGSALADPFSDKIIENLTEQGFSRIEISNGRTQTKVEAIRGTQKVEAIYDRTTGRIVKQEVDTVDDGDDTSPGITVRERARNFVRVARAGHEDGEDDDHGRGRGDDDHGGDDHGRDDHGSDDDHGGDDHGDDRNDDHGRGHDNDDHDNDRGGRDSHDHDDQHDDNDDHDDDYGDDD